LAHEQETEKMGVKNKNQVSLQQNRYFAFRNPAYSYEGWNFNSGNYLFTTNTK